jgi:lysine decarboxylase
MKRAKEDAVEKPLVDAWRLARSTPRRPMHVPGHKQRFMDAHDGWGFDFVGDTVRDDIPLQSGVDDQAYSNGYLLAAEALWARAVGADHSRFLVGGSSQGNIAALSTVGDEATPIAVDRTSHRSVQAGLVLIGATPTWVYPRIHPDFNIPIGVEAHSLASVANTVNGFFVTSPSYVGTLSEVASLAAIAQRRGEPLIIDQAWGAHLDFLPGRGAIQQGADFSVTSVHKALLGYTQTAVVSMRDGVVPRSTFDRWVDLTSTTSPSGTLLATIDATRAVMERDGGGRLERLIEAVGDARTTLARVPGLVVLSDETAGCPVDPTKLTLILPGTGADGVALGEDLWSIGHGAEFADHDTLSFTISVADDPESIIEFADVMAVLVESHRDEPRPAASVSIWKVQPEVVLTPREAFLKQRRRVSMSDAIGEVSAEQFCPYPPGVPLLAPGERVTQEAVAAIREASTTCRIAYCSDPTLETILVVIGDT